MIRLRWPWQWGATDPEKIRDQLAQSERKLTEAGALADRAEKVNGWLRIHMRNNDFASMLDEHVFGGRSKQ